MFRCLEFHNGGDDDVSEAEHNRECLPWIFAMEVFVTILIFAALVVFCCYFCLVENVSVQGLVIPMSPRSYLRYEPISDVDQTNDHPPLIERIRIVYNPDDHACLATQDHR